MTLLNAIRYGRWLGFTAALIAIAWLWHSRAEWRDSAQAWKSAHEARQMAFDASHDAANAKLNAQRVVQKNVYDTLAERADNAESKVNSLLSASERFARNNRVRQQTAQGGSGYPAGACQGDGAPCDSGPGSDAVLVPLADFRTLVRNTGRLIRAHDWFVDLETRGLAEAAPAAEEMTP